MQAKNSGDEKKQKIQQRQKQKCLKYGERLLFWICSVRGPSHKNVQAGDGRTIEIGFVAAQNPLLERHRNAAGASDHCGNISRGIYRAHRPAERYRMIANSWLAGNCQDDERQRRETTHGGLISSTNG